jgi:hypothetical protein
MSLAWVEAAKVSGESARSFSEYVASAVRVIIDRAYSVSSRQIPQTAGPSWSGAEGVRC